MIPLFDGYDDDLLSDVLLFAEAALSSSFGTTGFRNDWPLDFYG